MRDWLEQLTSGELFAFGGVVTAVALLLWVLARLIVGRELAFRLRAPAFLLVLHIGLSAATGLLPVGSPRKYLGVLALLLLLLALGRVIAVLLLDWFWRGRTQREAPRIVRDIVEGLILLVSLIAVLRAAGVDPTSLLTTSALLTAIVGLSMQDTLGNLFAGLSLQAERVFVVGEWVQLDRDGLHIGRVIEVSWRATKIQTLDGAEVTIPNGQVARSAIMNFSRPTTEVRRSIFVQIPYDVPSRAVQEHLLKAVAELPGVLRRPEPTVVTHGFEDYGIEYWLRFFINDFEHRDLLDGLARDRIWTALRRAGIPMATPSHRIQLRSQTDESEEAERQRTLAARMKAIRELDFLRDLPDEAISALASGARNVDYDPGEVVVRQGEHGDDLYLCLTGELAVLHALDTGTQREVAQLGPGGMFGELSAMTGEPRSATVKALTHCELVVVGKPAFAGVLETSASFAERISERLAERQAALEALRPTTPQQQRASVELHKGQLLRRVRDFFKL